MCCKINIFLSVAALVILFVFVIVLPSDSRAEAFENRAMEAFPQISIENVLSGDFFENLESYLLDNTAFRTDWLFFQEIAKVSYGLNIRGGSVMVYFGADDSGNGLLPDAARNSEHVPVIVNVSEPIGEDLRFNENAMFYLRYIENRESAARYAEVLNSFAEELPENVRIFSMLAPIKVEFMGARYAAVNSSQLETTEYINSLLNGRIIPVDAYGRLAENADRYIYFRTDHHWTALGAYYAYRAFADAAGFEAFTIDNYTEYAIEGFIGSLATGTRNRTVLNHPDTLYFYLNNDFDFSVDLYNIPTDLSGLSYRIFLGGDTDLLRFTSSVENGRTIVIIKDSFANALVPWLAPNYQNIVIIDPRQFTGGAIDIISEFDNVDLLFVNYMPATAMPDLIEQIYDAR